MMCIARLHYVFSLLIMPYALCATPDSEHIQQLMDTENYSIAITHCQKILVQDPHNNDIRCMLGTIYAAQNNICAASTEWEHVLRHCPQDQQLRTKLANLYENKEYFKQALDHYKYLMVHEPNNVDVAFRAASTELKIGNIDNALALFTTITTRVRNPISVLYNIGYTLKTAGRPDEALAYFDKIIALKPDYDAAHLARGFTLLYKGDFIDGWKQHERYLKSAKKNADALRALLKNNAIAGKHIVLIYEGGLGDTLMFIRYAKRFKTLGAYVTCMVQKPLIHLLANHPFIDALRTVEQGYPPSFDASATLMTLPALFYDTQDTMPCSIPYLYPQQKLVHHWRTQLKSHKKLHIGLCWQADVHNDISRLPIARRGMPLALWHTLLTIPDIAVYSLQRFDGVEQIQHLPAKCMLHVFDDMDTRRGNFVDTAALIMNLDLVISTDTATAHLAGALGKPVILLLPYAVDWRWICGRTDSPWYPTMRIFKQKQPFNWESVVTEVHTYLEEHYDIHMS